MSLFELTLHHNYLNFYSLISLQRYVLIQGVNDARLKCLNFSLLVARFHIYKMIMNNRRPTLEVLEKDVKRYYLCEKYLAFVNGACQKF